MNPLKNPSFFRGVALTQLAALGGGLFFVFFQRSVQTVPPLLAAYTVFIFAFFYSALPSLPQLFRSAKSEWSKKNIALIGGLALTALVGNTAIGIALQSLPPSSAHLLQRSETLFTLLIGVYFLREGGVRVLIVAAVFFSLGVYVLYDNQRQTTPPAALTLLPFLMGMLSAFCFALMQTFSRQLLPTFNAHLINSVRLLALVICLTIFYPPLARDLVNMPLATLQILAIAAFVGPFIGRVSYINAAYHIGIARAALIASVSPIYTMGLQYLISDITVNRAQVLGSAFLIVAVSLPIIAHYQRKVVK